MLKTDIFFSNSPVILLQLSKIGQFIYLRLSTMQSQAVHCGSQTDQFSFLPSSGTWGRQVPWPRLDSASAGVLNCGRGGQDQRILETISMVAVLRVLCQWQQGEFSGCVQGCWHQQSHSRGTGPAILKQIVPQVWR